MTRFTTRLELSALEGREVPSVVPTLAVLKKPDLPAVAPITFTVAAPADQVRGVVAAGKVMNQSLAAFPAQKATPAVAQPGAAALDPGARITPAPQSSPAAASGLGGGPKGSLQQQMFGFTAPASTASPLTLKATTRPAAGTPSALTAGTDAFKAWSQANGESRAVNRTEMQSDDKGTDGGIIDAAISFFSDLLTDRVTQVDTALDVAGDVAETTGGKVGGAVAGVAFDALVAPVAAAKITGGHENVSGGILETVGGRYKARTDQLGRDMDEWEYGTPQAGNQQKPNPNGDAIIRGGAATLGTFGGVTIRGHLTQPVPGETVWMKIAPSAGRGLIADSMAAGQGTKINPARGDGGVEVGGPAAPRDGVDCPPEKQGNGVGTPGRPAA
jgi:hypothetical protein